jgi:hypothetical protein
MRVTGHPKPRGLLSNVQNGSFHPIFLLGLKSLISAVSDFKSLAKIVKIPQSTFNLPQKAIKNKYFYVFSPQIGRNFVLLQV